jgi:diguanylate cyclase
MKSKPKESRKRVPAKKASLTRVLNKHKKITKHVKHAATELTSINEVLQQGVEDNIPVRTIEAAIIQNAEVENKVAGAADDLHKANVELAKEVTERVVIEAELADTKTDLAEVRDDLSKSQAKEKETRRSSLQDALTGLPNRLSFEQDLDQGLRQANRHGWALAVLFIDIDKFKSVNDSYGHRLGDKVLLMMADRLQSFLRDQDTVSRWGGDEFVCLLLEVKQEADVIRLAEKSQHRHCPLSRRWRNG